MLDCFLEVNSFLQSRDTIFDLMTGRHLIPLFPEKVYILQNCSKSHDDLISDLMIGRHLIPLFPKNNLLQKNVTFTNLFASSSICISYFRTYQSVPPT